MRQSGMGIWDVPLPVSATCSKDLRTAPWSASALRCLRTLIRLRSCWAALCCRCNCLLFTETQHTQPMGAWPAKSENRRKKVSDRTGQPGNLVMEFTKTQTIPPGPEPLAGGCGNCWDNCHRIWHHTLSSFPAPYSLCCCNFMAFEHPKNIATLEILYLPVNLEDASSSQVGRHSKSFTNIITI